jgi:hypothetical protein
MDEPPRSLLSIIDMTFATSALDKPASITDIGDPIQLLSLLNAILRHTNACEQGIRALARAIDLTLLPKEGQ